MPSRPRPLPRARGPLYWLARPRRRRAPTARDAIHRDDGGDACQTWGVLFDGPRTKLPVATLLASGAQTRRRMDLARWLSLRWDWVRPRTVPLIAAFLGLLLTLGAVKYTALLAYDHNSAPRPRAAPVLTVPGDPAALTRLHQVHQGQGCEGAGCARGCSHRAAH
jgi:hypothetical protein